MDKNEFVINSRMFGGYNKKQTEAYIQELQRLIEETRTELEAARQENGKLNGKLAEAENCYKVLWERSKGQEETIRQQEEIIKQQNDNADRQEERIKKQERKLKELADKNAKIPFDKIEKILKKQLDKAKRR